MKAKFLTILKYLFFIGLGAFFVWLSVRHINAEKWEQIKGAVARGRKWVILPVVLFLFIAHYSRAMRWKLLMEPLGYKPSNFNAFATVMIGYLALFVHSTEKRAPSYHHATNTPPSSPSHSSFEFFLETLRSLVMSMQRLWLLFLLLFCAFVVL